MDLLGGTGSRCSFPVQLISVVRDDLPSLILQKLQQQLPCLLGTHLIQGNGSVKAFLSPHGVVGFTPQLTELLLVWPRDMFDDLGEGIHVPGDHSLLVDSGKVPVELEDGVVEADHLLVLIAFRFILGEGVHQLIGHTHGIGKV